MNTSRHKRRPAAEPARIAPDYSAMLAEAVSNPGTVAAAYAMFHEYSIGNQLLAAFELAERRLPLSPIASYRRWLELGRQVRKGEHAISLCMPVTCRARRRDEDATEDNYAEARDESGAATFTRFVLRPHWFSLAQTDGPDLPPPPAIPEWDAARALAALQVEEVEFSDLRGNVLGYARDRQIAVSPLSPLPNRTRFHELAHVVLGHTADGAEMTDDAAPARAEREVEAEAVAYLCLASLSLPNLDESRGYLQAWQRGGEVAIDDRRTARIFRAADQILRAGRPTAATTETASDEAGNIDLQRAAA